jgi:hypothetical protein
MPTALCMRLLIVDDGRTTLCEFGARDREGTVRHEGMARRFEIVSDMGSLLAVGEISPDSPDAIFAGDRWLIPGKTLCLHHSPAEMLAELVAPTSSAQERRQTKSP